MRAVTTISLDIAKSDFQVHGVEAHGKVVVRRQLKRRYVLPFFKKLSPCLVGIEACATSHHWSRELQALGHTVRLMPPAYVKPYLKRQKNDAVRTLLRYITGEINVFEHARTLDAAAPVAGIAPGSPRQVVICLSHSRNRPAASLVL